MPQSERTPFYPRSPYAVAKIYAYWITVNYREAYDMFACNGILFNHESPLRGETFVTRKITRAVAKIALGRQDIMYIGNLDSERDWGHAKDYVEAMWRILQQEKPEDFVIATGVTTKIRVFIEKVFSQVGFEIDFIGSGVDESAVLKGINESVYSNIIGAEFLKDAPQIGTKLVQVDPRYFRPTEVDLLKGDATKSREKLGWRPKYSVDKLIKEMIHSDVNVFKANIRHAKVGGKELRQYE